MLTDELNKVAYLLIKHQHELARRFLTARSRYEQETQDAQTRFSQENAANEEKWKAAQTEVEQVLQPIIMQETSAFAQYHGNEWQGIVSAEFADHETPENRAYYVERMRMILHSAGLWYSQKQVSSSAIEPYGAFYELVGRILQSLKYYQQTDSYDALDKATARGVELRRKKFSNLVENGMLPQKANEIDGAIKHCEQISRTLGKEIDSFLSSHHASGVSNETFLWSGGCTGTVVLILLIVFLSILVGFSGGVFFVSFLLGLVVFVGILFAMKSSATAKIKRLAGELKATVTLAEKLGQRKLARSEQRYQRQKEDIQSRSMASQNQLDQTYAQFIDALRRDFETYRQGVNKSFAGMGWDDASQWDAWTPSTASPAVVRLGTLKFQHPQLPTIPAMLACPAGQNVLFKAVGEGRDVAAVAIEALVLRLLAIHQPGQVRFTLIDPAGSGKNVAGFIPLADLDKELIGPRAWTDERHIDAQLIDVQEKMEVVIQQLQGKKFKTLDEYNAQAEVTEPYHIVVVTGFPAEFTDRSASRLLKIATNGRAAGFSVVMMMDLESQKPYNFNVEDFERVATVFSWNGKEFVWVADDFATSALSLDTPPPAPLFDRILKQVGSISQSARRVAVNFERYLPRVIWDKQQTTDREMNCELGPASATRSQSLVLNSDSEVHVLVAGKTGSGKTNLMHVLIMGLALKYHPDELEFYLIDLKAVGFVPYGLYKLPHARVVASESEREFAFSVLQRLDEELRNRAYAFKKANVDKLADFRRVMPGTRMPRILLIVDEFQELFSSDEDYIHRKSLELLESLARLGRAFGIHLLLGSQTLRGAYSVSKATMSQMAVRIALQCDTEDSEYILGSSNTAARLLSRSGAAIYNENQGAIGDNREFQCAWMSNEELARYLDILRRRAQYEGYVPKEEQVVFQGNAYATVASNHLLAQVLEREYKRVKMLPAVPSWIGEPIAIKQPTSVVFRSQAANNLLLVAQQDQAREALGIIITILYSLAAQHAPGTARFYIADYGQGDTDYAGTLARVAQMLAPHQITMLTRRNLTDTIQRISGEVQQRLDQDEVSGGHMYLFIYGLQRARDLRPSDSFDYSMGFGSEDTSAAPHLAKSFTTILRDGPEVGVHTITWCDTVTNLNRSLERSAWREFDLRIAFQMSNEDSNNLIGSPDARQLGFYRAFLYNDEANILEKFRPYELPDEQWCREAAEKIVRKA